MGVFKDLDVQHQERRGQAILTAEELEVARKALILDKLRGSLFVAHSERITREATERERVYMHRVRLIIVAMLGGIAGIGCTLLFTLVH